MIALKNLFKLSTPIFYFLLTISSPSYSAQSIYTWKHTPQKKILPNGIPLIYHHDESSPITVLQVLVKGGKGAVPEGKEGLAYLTTRLTIEIPDQGKALKLMKQASSISIQCKGDFSLISIQCISSNLDETLNVMTKILRDPLFSGLRIDLIKEHMNYKIKSAEDDSVIMGHNAHLTSFFGKTGYGGSIYGTEESLKSIKKKDIQSFYKKYFNTANMILSVSSDLNEEELIETIQKYFLEFHSGEPEEFSSSRGSIPEERNIFMEKDTKQTLVSIAFPLPKLSTRNTVMAFMLENLLGKSVNSKLWFLRSKEKLAYNVNSQATQMKEGGILNSYLETENNKKDRSLEALKKVLQTLYEEGITEEELEATKVNSKASFLRINEIKETRTSNLAFFEAVGLGYEFINQFFVEVDNTSLEEINSYIKDILDPNKAVEVIIGPKPNE
ncbi:MAG: M16 family metallopeptidase [Candidatus Aminicenantaceae bacterium]